MRKLLGICFLVGLSCASSGYAQSASDVANTRFDQWKTRCDREFVNPKLSLLTGKISYIPSDITDEMLKNEVRPTKSERSALAIFYTTTERCNSIAREIYPASAESEAMYAATLDNLFMLKEGRLTYGEYNRREKQALYDVTARWKKKYAESSTPQSSSFYLSCVAESPDMARGLEFIYLVDPQNNAVSASRGGVPEAIAIGAADIRFNVKNNDGSLGTVQISRLSGRYNYSSGSFLVTGQCQQTSQRKF